MIHLLEQQRQAQIAVGGGGGTELILNTTFDDASNLTLDSAWSIAGGVAHYNRTTNNYIKYVISQDILNGDEFTISFDISNTTLAGARIIVYAENNSFEQMVPTTIFANGSHSVDYTHTGATRTAIWLIGTNNASGGEFDIDNFSVLKTN